MFTLKVDRSSQFDGVNLRGFVDEYGKPKNRFATTTFGTDFKEYKARQKARKKDQKDRQKKRAANLQKQLERASRKKARKEKKKTKARKRKRKERNKKKPKREMKIEIAEIFLIKKEGEANEKKQEHLSRKIVPKREVKKEISEPFLNRTGDINDEFVEEEKENIPPNSSVDNSIKENNNVVRNYSKEAFDDRRVVAESFF